MDESELKSLSPLFADLGKKERREVALRAEKIDVPEGKELAHEGDFAYEFFVIAEGRAEVIHEGDHVADLGPGDFFGEMGILGSQRRVATVTARSPMEVVVMTDQALRALKREEPRVARRLAEAVEDRLAADAG